ncbi:CRISPR-associated endonuclease Cas2 [Viridibacillus sp. YIM B01967]|uniref:CRISPR-associated endoribonuclease Cas2 n=1 Tax=Viridibacillus soli TaxID=2798301 RepID=A0ABS1HAL8_9BACL|nr:CRISPR-associated endonuclease Cas2 [Viridibacillus soli]MBK3496453.1 CRISPR-associated endonuclease Cas2 [Viridibacillus soli]
MLVLITYDISTKNKAGEKRLRNVAKVCENHGIRVQNSVFECVVNAAQFTQLKLTLNEIINKEKDSIRYYQLGNNYKSKVEHVGAKESIDVEDTLIF